MSGFAEHGRAAEMGSAPGCTPRSGVRGDRRGAGWAGGRVLIRGVLLATVLATAVSAPDAVAQDSRAAPDERPPAASQHDLVIFDRERPLFLRLELRAAGAPQSERWLADVRRQFALLDTHADGAITKQELEVAESRGAALSEADVSPFDGRITVEELGGLIRSQGHGPMQFAAPAGRRTTNESELGERLFDTLDRDSDGRLSPAELAGATEAFRQIDFDEDGAISAAELQSSDPYFRRFAQSAETGTPGLPIFSLSAGDSATELARQLRSRYGDGRGSRIGPVVMGLAEPVFERYDADGNGELDFDELRYFLRNPVPELVLRVELDRADGKSSPVSVGPPDSEPAVPVRTSEAGLVSIVLAMGQIELRCLEPAGDADITAALQAQFRGLDGDSNLYLDQKEVASDALIGPVFPACDRNADGRLFEDELLAAFTESLQSARSRTQVSATDRGRDLFAILDADGNRRIGQAEFDALSRRIGLWDDDGDGAIRPAEVPHVYQLEIGPGQPAIGGRMLPVSMGSASLPGTPRIAAPAWFTGMDRNDDNAVSAGEFLGPADDFRQIDRNTDGRIDAAEASRIR